MTFLCKKCFCDIKLVKNSFDRNTYCTVFGGNFVYIFLEAIMFFNFWLFLKMYISRLPYYFSNPLKYFQWWCVSMRYIFFFIFLWLPLLGKNLFIKLCNLSIQTTLDKNRIRQIKPTEEKLSQRCILEPTTKVKMHEKLIFGILLPFIMM